jgi:hypothetical protein
VHLCVCPCLHGVLLHASTAVSSATCAMSNKILAEKLRPTAVGYTCLYLTTFHTRLHACYCCDMHCCNSLTDACLPQRTVPVQHIHKAASKLKYLNLTHHTDITGATWHKVQHGALDLGQTGTSFSANSKQKSSGRTRALRFTHCEYAELHEVYLDGCAALTDKGKFLHFCNFACM